MRYLLRSISSSILARLRKDIFKITFSLTYACNLGCRHCNIWRIYRDEPKLARYELSADEIITTVSKSKPSVVSLTGGEPFLRRDFEDILLGVLALKNRPLVVSINTNGTLPERIHKIVKRAVDAMPSYKKLLVSISLDGLPEFHDINRGLKGSFSRAVKTFQLLKDLEKENQSLHVAFEYTIMNDNIGHFSKLLSTLNGSIGEISLNDFILNFVQTFDYYNISNGSRSTLKADSIKLVEEGYKILDVLKRKKHTPLGMHAIFLDAFIRKARNHLVKGINHKCFAGELSVFIDPYGNIYPCLPFYGKYLLGRLRELNYDVRNAIRSERAAKFIKNIRPSCNCWTPCESYTTLSLRPWILVPSVLKTLMRR